jgi:hypothetical protein
MDPSIGIVSFIKIVVCVRLMKKGNTPDVFYTLERDLSNRFRRKHDVLSKTFRKRAGGPVNFQAGPRTIRHTQCVRKRS